MIGFLGFGLAPVVMSPEQEARHCLLSCQPKEIQHAHLETDEGRGWRDVRSLNFA